MKQSPLFLTEHFITCIRKFTKHNLSGIIRDAMQNPDWMALDSAFYSFKISGHFCSFNSGFFSEFTEVAKLFCHHSVSWFSLRFKNPNCSNQNHLSFFLLFCTLVLLFTVILFYSLSKLKLDAQTLNTSNSTSNEAEMMKGMWKTAKVMSSIKWPSQCFACLPAAGSSSLLMRSNI